MNTNRRDYLINLGEEYEVDTDIVMMLAELLGESADRDGLITWLLLVNMIDAQKNERTTGDE